MSRSYSVTFNVLGNLDPSLIAALQAAQNRIRGLQGMQRSLNAAALRQAARLNQAQGLMKQFEAYRKLEKAIGDNIAKQAQLKRQQAETLAQHQNAVKTLDDMKRAQRALVQARALR